MGGCDRLSMVSKDVDKNLVAKRHNAWSRIASGCEGLSSAVEEMTFFCIRLTNSWYHICGAVCRGAPHRRLRSKTGCVRLAFEAG